MNLQSRGYLTSYMVFPDQQRFLRMLCRVDILYISSSKTKAVYIEIEICPLPRAAMHINRMESATCGRDYMMTLSVAQAMQ
jgi:hypothetical protein